MTRQTREFAVFVGSPSDMPAEREAVLRAARSVNEALGRPFALRLNVEGWEQVQPGMGRPQSLINARVDECDVFIGLLHRRWGTPTGTHTSGFEEEFDCVLARRDEDNPPLVGLFFRQVAPEHLADAGPELTKVLAFQSRIRDQHTALYKRFSSVEDLELAVQAWFTTFLGKVAAVHARPPEGAESSTDGTATGVSADGVPLDEALDEARTQLGKNLEAWADIVLGRKPTAELNRDRLLAFALAVSQDDEVLPTHLANRLYRHRESLDLAFAEGKLWLRTLCADAARSSGDGWDRVVPGWYFLGKHGAADGLADILLQDPSSATRGALVLLRRLSTRPSALWDVTPSPPSEPDSGSTQGHSVSDSCEGQERVASVAARWVRLFTDNSTRIAAIDYLYDLAKLADTPLLDAIARAIAGATWGAEPAAAIAAIKGGPGAAVAFLLAHPYAVSDWVAKASIEAVPSLEPEQLVALVDSRHGCDKLRELAFDRFLELSTPQPAAGAAAFSAMLRSSEASRSHLFDRLRVHGTDERRGWLQAAWEALPEDERRPELSDRIAAVTTSTAELAARFTPGFSGLHAWIALSHQGTPQFADRARQVLSTGADEFIADVTGVLDEAEAQQVEDFVSGSGRNAALRILASLPEEDRHPKDVELARQEVAEATWVTERQAVLTLAEFAQAQDIPALLEGAMTPILHAANERRAVLEVACALGGRDVILSLIEQDDEEAAGVGAAAIAVDPATADGQLIEMLYHRFARVRRPALGALLSRFDRDRLETLLNEYPTRPGHHFYDVIVELDWRLYGEGDDRSAAF